MMGVFMDPILIRDPMDESNNVGRNCFRFSQIQDLFWNTYSKLVGMATAVRQDVVEEDSLWFMRQLFPSITDLPASSTL